MKRTAQPKKTGATNQREAAAALIEQRGVEYMAELGKKGGPAVLKKYGREHFVEMAKRSAASQKAVRDAGKKALGR